MHDTRDDEAAETPPRALLELGRRGTTGAVSTDQHNASRARLLARLATPAKSARRAAVHAPAPRFNWVALASALGAVGVAAVVTVTALRAPSAIVKDTPVPTVTSGAARARPDAKSAHIRFRVHPADATLYMDDSPLPGNPADLVVPCDGLSHRFTAEARGFKKRTERVVLDGNNRDVSLELTLAAEVDR